MRKENKAPIGIEELRRIQSRQRINEDAMKLLWEIHRLRDVITEIDGLRVTLERVWRDESLGNLSALHQLKKVLSQAL